MTNSLLPNEFCAETIALKQTLESGFIVLAERLARIKREQLWNQQWDSFAAFCQEMDINEATASRLITVHQTYIENYQLTPEQLTGHSWYNLYQLRRVIPEGASNTDVKELVETAGELNRDDIKRMARDKEHGPCTHDWYELRMRQCRNCGERHAID